MGLCSIRSFETKKADNVRKLWVCSAGTEAFSPRKNLKNDLNVDMNMDGNKNIFFFNVNMNMDLV